MPFKKPLTKGNFELNKIMKSNNALENKIYIEMLF